MLRRDSKIHLAGISSIIVTIVASFWGFGLADKVFDFDSLVQEIKEGIRDPEIKQNKEEILVEHTEDESEQIEEIALEQDVTSEESLHPTKEMNAEPEIVSSESEFETEYDNYNQENKRTKAKLLQERIELLEERLFELSGSGTGWEGARHLSKFTTIKLKLEPIAGTELTEFRIMSGMLSYGGIGISLEEGKVSIEQNIFLIEIEHDEATDPYLTMTAKIIGSILDDNKIELDFEDQLLYLVKEDKTPIHLDLKTTLTF